MVKCYARDNFTYLADYTYLNTSDKENKMTTMIETSAVEVFIHKKNKPWSVKATLGLSTLLLMLSFIISLTTLGIGTTIAVSSSSISPENAQTLSAELSQSLILDGDYHAITYLFTALCLSPLIFYMAGRRKITTAAAYLGFDKKPSKKTFLHFNLAIVGYFIFSSAASCALGIEVPQSMIDMYNTADYLFLLFIVVVIAAPVFEELLFRGFMFKGLKYSSLGVTGTIVITSFLFTLIHAGQYNVSVLAVLFPLAIILGVSRYKSGGIYLPIYLHLVNNFYASVEMYFFMN